MLRIFFFLSIINVEFEEKRFGSPFDWLIQPVAVAFMSYQSYCNREFPTCQYNTARQFMSTTKL